MKEDLELSGYWSPSMDMANSYYGTLKISKGEIELDILGCTDFPKERFIVHGLTAKGKKITLYKCFPFNRTISSPGIPRATLSALYFFEGDFLSEDDINFEIAHLKINFLEIWLNSNGFTYYKQTEVPYTLSLKYELPDAILFFKNQEVEFSIIFDYYAPFYAPDTECHIRQECLIQIKKESGFSLDKLWEYVSIIKGFLSLAYFSDVNIESLKLIREDISLKTVYSGQNKSDLKEKKHRRHFLFDFFKLQSDFTRIFNQWYNLSFLVQPVISILLELFATENKINENRFLNIMQGIETFHRRLRSNTKLSSDEYKKFQKSIINVVPDEQKKWLKEKLAFANELSLKERLDELFEELNPTLVSHLFPNHKELIAQARDTRNYYTHYDPSLEKKALKGKDLYYLSERLKLLLLILLLKETGFGDKEATEIIIESSQLLFNHIIVK